MKNKPPSITPDELFVCSTAKAINKQRGLLKHQTQFQAMMRHQEAARKENDKYLLFYQQTSNWQKMEISMR